jgi:hypothetical protein
MSAEPMMAPILSHETIIAPAQLTPERPPLSADLPAPTAEQVQASDQAFREEQLVAGLIGMHVGILVLRDIAADTFNAPVEEEQPRRKPKLDDAKER